MVTLPRIVVAGGRGGACDPLANGEPVWSDPGEADNRRHAVAGDMAEYWAEQGNLWRLERADW